MKAIFSAAMVWLGMRLMALASRSYVLLTSKGILLLIRFAGARGVYLANVELAKMGFELTDRNSRPAAGRSMPEASNSSTWTN